MLKAVTALESAAEEELAENLTALKRQCRFLEKVYKYHSNVEDEVALYSPWNSRSGSLHVQPLLNCAEPPVFTVCGRIRR